MTSVPVFDPREPRLTAIGAAPAFEPFCRHVRGTAVQHHGRSCRRPRDARAFARSVFSTCRSGRPGRTEDADTNHQSNQQRHKPSSGERAAPDGTVVRVAAPAIGNLRLSTPASDVASNLNRCPRLGARYSRLGARYSHSLLANPEPRTPNLEPRTKNDKPRTALCHCNHRRDQAADAIAGPYANRSPGAPAAISLFTSAGAAIIRPVPARSCRASCAGLATPIARTRPRPQ